jgi:hypothetical protein
MGDIKNGNEKKVEEIKKLWTFVKAVQKWDEDINKFSENYVEKISKILEGEENPKKKFSKFHKAFFEFLEVAEIEISRLWFSTFGKTSDTAFLFTKIDPEFLDKVREEGDDEKIYRVLLLISLVQKNFGKARSKEAENHRAKIGFSQWNETVEDENVKFSLMEIITAVCALQGGFFGKTETQKYPENKSLQTFYNHNYFDFVLTETDYFSPKIETKLMVDTGSIAVWHGEKPHIHYKINSLDKQTIKLGFDEGEASLSTSPCILNLHICFEDGFSDLTKKHLKQAVLHL